MYLPPASFFSLWPTTTVRTASLLKIEKNNTLGAKVQYIHILQFFIFQFFEVSHLHIIHRCRNQQLSWLDQCLSKMPKTTDNAKFSWLNHLWHLIFIFQFMIYFGIHVSKADSLLGIIKKFLNKLNSFINHKLRVWTIWQCSNCMTTMSVTDRKWPRQKKPKPFQVWVVHPVLSWQLTQIIKLWDTR